jgi:hypothetical protein
MDDLVVWLRQQLADDERCARGASADQGDSWRAVDGDDAFVSTESGGIIRDGDYGGRLVVAEHIALHDPARVLRDVARDRLILDELDRLPHYAWDGREEYGCPKYTDPEAWRGVYGEGAEQTCNCGRDDHVDRVLRLLALPYSERPGYREEEWKP